MPVNMGRQATSTFLNPQDRAAERRWLRNTSFPSRCMVEIVRVCTLNCTLDFETHVLYVQYVQQKLVELNGCHCCN